MLPPLDRTPVQKRKERIPPLDLPSAAAATVSKRTRQQQSNDLEPSSMHTFTLHGARFMTTQRKPGDRPRRAALERAADVCTSQLAVGWEASSSLSPKAAQTLGRITFHAKKLAEQGSAEATLRIDELAWERWCSFAQLLEIDPHLKSGSAALPDDAMSALMAAFLMYVYPTMKGKGGRAWAKPRSAFGQVLAVMRCFRRWGVSVPKAKAIEGQLRGLLRMYKDVYGTLALAPKRAMAIRFTMVQALVTIPVGTKLGPFTFNPERDPMTQCVRIVAAVLWETGHRLAELIGAATDPEPPTRSNVVFVLDGMIITDPDAAQVRRLLSMCGADVDPQLHRLMLGPAISKTDQLGEVHCPFPSTLPLHGSPAGAAKLLLQQELDHPCRGHARQRTALVRGPLGGAPSHTAMGKFLWHALQHLYDSAVADAYSWHSFRCGRACALHAAGCPDNIIQLLCRWVSPDSLRLYRRLPPADFAYWGRQANNAVVDGIQMANVPIVDGSEGFAALQQDVERDAPQAVRSLLAQAQGEEPCSTHNASRNVVPLPLQPDNAVGRRALVPRSMWPDYTCNEHSGKGWEVLITKVNQQAATVAFIHAVTARGLPYADERVQLHALTPL